MLGEDTDMPLSVVSLTELGGMVGGMWIRWSAVTSLRHCAFATDIQSVNRYPNRHDQNIAHRGDREHQVSESLHSKLTRKESSYALVTTCRQHIMTFLLRSTPCEQNTP